MTTTCHPKTRARREGVAGLACKLAPLLLLMSCNTPPTSLGGAQDANAGIASDASPPIATDAQTAPGADIALDLGRSRIDLSIAEESYLANACELDGTEQCIGAAGLRRVLRFTVETANLGDADLVIGDPSQDPNYEFSMCHQHYHFSGYAQYRLLDPSGNEVLVGRKQAFCLLDSEPYAAGASLDKKYTCFDQGLQEGWVDAYTADLPCQLLDITEVPDGDYQLEVITNPEGLLEDSSPLNNQGSIALTIGDAKLETPTETCADLSARYLDRLERECDWDFAGEYTCSPGSPASVGCSQSCDLGTCTGDPMIRVCDAETVNCTSALALSANDNRCGGVCPMATNFLCPPSGRLAVYTASHDHDQPYTCTIAQSTSGS